MGRHRTVANRSEASLKSVLNFADHDMHDEESTIEAKVQQRLTTILAEQQTAFAASMEQAVKLALAEIEKSRAELEVECRRLNVELEAARALHSKANREGEKLANEAFAKHQREYSETIRISWLRELVRLHLEGGKTTHEIMKWLGVDRQFVERIREVVNRVEQLRSQQGLFQSPAGSPRVRFVQEGRSGLVFFESSEGSFDTWWEMGYGALAIIAVPTIEQWETSTGLPRDRRLEILDFVGREFIRTQAPHGSFILGERVLTVYSD